MQSYNFLHRHPVSEIFSDDLLSEVDIESPIELLRSIYHRPADASDLNRMLYLDWKFTLADNDLVKVKKMCELAGVAVHFPLLDKSVVDFSCQVPASTKLHRFKLRDFYKKALTGWLLNLA